MKKQRSICTSIWSDVFFEELTAKEKLLFIYLLTNEKTNMLGAYEISIKKICYDTDLEKSDVKKSLTKFQEHNKIKYEENYIIISNFLKHQKFNDNMKKSAIDAYNELPNELKINGIDISKKTLDQGFETLCNGFCNPLPRVRKYEYEYEKEKEIETEDEKEKKREKKEKKSPPPPFLEFENYALEKMPNVDTEKLKLKYEAWSVNSWKDGHGNQIKNWKSKLLNTLPFLKNDQNGNKKNEPKIGRQTIDEINANASGW